MIRTIIAILTTAAMLTLVGCGGPQGGVVTIATANPRIGYAPDIQFRSYDNQMRSLRRNAAPVMIVVFAEPAGYNCCGVLDPLASTADDLRPWPITVIQVSLPTPECSFGPGCDQCQIWEEDIVTLCDNKRIAWTSYDRPAPRTAFLVDDEFRIVASDSVDNLDRLVGKAKILAEEIEDRDEALYINY